MSPRPETARSATLALVVAMGLAAGCRRAERIEPHVQEHDAASPALSADAPTPAAPLPKAAETPRADAGDDDEALFSGVPKAARSIGHTSVVLKVELTTGKKAAFKPASRRGPVRYKGEIAARRLALALGLPNVPRAFFRTFDAAKLAAARNADEMIVERGIVKGALIPWIDGLELLALESAPLSAQWKHWLVKGGTIPDDQRELARQISTLVAFDFVTGNWDRWSGGNVGIDKATGTLLYIDNDGAFFEAPPAEALQKNRKRLEGIDKLSRSFVARVRALDDEALARAVGEETPGVPLLSTRALAGVAQRRSELLRIIDAKVADSGDDATLAFP